MWAADPDCPPQGRAAGGGRAPSLRRPSRRRRAPPPRGRPPATPAARNDGSPERVLWGRCWVPRPTSPETKKRGQRGLAARPMDGRPGEEERLTPDAPNSGEMSPPRGHLEPAPRRATPHRARTQKGQCRARKTGHRRPQHVGNGPRLPAPRTGGRERASAWPQTPLKTARGSPPATPSSHPHSTQRRLARAHAAGPVLGPDTHSTRARERQAMGPGCPPPGGVAGKGKAPDTRRPSQWLEVPPPQGDLPPPPQSAAPRTGAARQRDSAGPPRPHTPAQSTWEADPDCPPLARTAGGGRAPNLRRPSQWREAPLQETPFRHSHSAQHPLARAHTVGLVLGPHANTTAPGKHGQGGLAARPQDGQPGEGDCLTPNPPHNGEKSPPRGNLLPAPPARNTPEGTYAKGTVPGLQARTPAPRACGRRTPTARPKDGQPGEDERLTSDTPHNGARHPPPRDALPPPPQQATSARKRARCGAGAGSPRPHHPRPNNSGNGA